MPSPFQGIDTVSAALRAFQRGLDVSGHNLANVNTKGYTRQTVDYGANTPVDFFSSHRLSLGTGVGIVSINRVQDMFLQARMLGAQSDLNRFQTKANNLQQISGVIGGADGNPLTTNLNRLFNAFSALAANPSDTAARREVQTAGDALASTVRGSYANLESAKAGLQTQVSQTLGRIQELADQIATLNKQIRQEVAAGTSPNDLLDQRDGLVNELGGLMAIQTYPQQDGTVVIHSGSMPLVDQVSSFTVPTSYDASTFSLSDANGTYGVTGGKLYGLFESINQVNSYESQLNTFATDLRDQVNLLHESGITGNATTLIDFFAPPGVIAGPAAAEFDLSVEVKADIQNIAAGTTGNAGDGGLALSLSQLRDQSNVTLGSKTYAEYLTDLISGAGHDANAAIDGMVTKSAVVDQIDQQQQAVSGVSIDEEMANMMRLQRSYQAAAKALSLINQSTDDLLNMVQ